MDYSLLWKAYILGWFVAAPIGPVNLEIIRRGLRHRLAAGLMVGVGATMVDVGYMLAVGFGLTRFFRYPAFLLACLGVGGCLMAWLAWGALREARAEWIKAHAGSVHAASDALAEPVAAQAPRRILLRSWLVGLGMTVSNPMTIVFWATLPGLLFEGRTPAAREVFLAAGGVWGGTISWVLFLMVMLALGRRLVGPRLFAVASGLGGLAMAWFAARFWWLAFHLGEITSQFNTGATP
jgi:threonine/homoserine/homoserine lactone efflux protein